MTAPLVLLPGMMADARLFGPQIMEFGKDRAIHLPPIGQDDRIEAMAASVLAGAPHRFAVVGASLGGLVAIEIARVAPNRVTHLGLINVNPLAETPDIAADREVQIVRVMAGRLLDVMKEGMQPDHLAPGPKRQEISELLLEMAAEQGEGVFVRQSRALQRRNYEQSAFRKLTIPTMVMCGAYDTLYPVKRQEIIAELIPNAELVVVPGAGQMPTLENPNACSAAIREWLKR